MRLSSLILLCIIFAPILLSAQTSTVDLGKKSYSSSLVRTAPKHPICKDIEDEFLSRKCLSKEITQHVQENLDTELLRDLTQDNDLVKLAVFFIINDLGETELHKVYPESETVTEEMDRIVDLMPNMIPGVRKGEPVNVSYSLQITYRDDEMTVSSR